MQCRVTIAVIDQTVIFAMNRSTTPPREVFLMTNMLASVVQQAAGSIILCPSHTRCSFGWILECEDGEQAEAVANLFDCGVDDGPNRAA